MNKITTSMDRVTVRFVRAAKAPWGAGSADFATGDRAAVPVEVARDLIARGDAEMDGERPAVVQKGLDSIIVELPGDLAVSKSVDGRRVVSCTASTGAIDRVGDVVVASGWRLGEYRKNPVVLLSHDHALPVARAERVGVVGNALTAQIAFPNQGVAEKSDETWRLITAGILKGVSVGFKPLRSTPMANGGWRYEECELLEISVVSVGANAQALIEQSPFAQRSVPETTPPKSARKPASGRMLRLRREVAELRAKVPRRTDRAAAELVELKRSTAPERAQALAVDAKAKGRTRSAKAAGEFSKDVS